MADLLTPRGSDLQSTYYSFHRSEAYVIISHNSSIKKQCSKMNDDGFDIKWLKLWQNDKYIFTHVGINLKQIIKIVISQNSKRYNSSKSFYGWSMHAYTEISSGINSESQKKKFDNLFGSNDRQITSCCFQAHIQNIRHVSISSTSMTTSLVPSLRLPSAMNCWILSSRSRKKRDQRLCCAWSKRSHKSLTD